MSEDRLYVLFLHEIWSADSYESLKLLPPRVS